MAGGKIGTFLSFIIVNWNTRELLLSCLGSIYETVKGIPFETFVVDNGSLDGSSEAVRAGFPRVKLIENDRNVGFARGANQALGKMRGRYAVLLNTDCILQERAIEELISFMDRTREAGIAGGRLLHKDGTRQNSVDNFPSIATILVNKSLLSLLFPGIFPSKRRKDREPLEVDSVLGACMMVRKEAIDEVGLLDEGYFFFLEETDWCYRMREKGWKTFHVPTAEIIHLQGRTANKFPSLSRIEYYRSRYRFLARTQGRSALIILKIAIPIRLAFNLFLNFLVLIVTLGLVKRLRRRLDTYARLLFWHLRRCPPGDGLRGALEERAFVAIRAGGMKLRIRSRYKQALLEAGIEDVESLAGEGRIIKDGGRSTIFSLSLTGFPEKIILKRYKHRSLLRILKDIFRESKAAREGKTACKFLAAGINVPGPLAFGERRILRFLRESFFISEEVPNSINLGTYALNFRRPLSRDKIQEKRRLIVLLARAIRWAHDRGFWHDDLKASNIMIKGNGLDFYFIDLDGARLGRKLSWRKRVKGLKPLHESLTPFITRTDRIRFLNEYSSGEPRRTFEKIKHLTAL